MAYQMLRSGSSFVLALPFNRHQFFALGACHSYAILTGMLDLDWNMSGDQIRGKFDDYQVPCFIYGGAHPW